MSTPRTVINQKKPITETKKSGPRDLKPVFDRTKIESPQKSSVSKSPDKSAGKSLTSSAVRPSAIDVLLMKNTANRDKV